MDALKACFALLPQAPGIAGLIAAWRGCQCHCRTSEADTAIVAVLRDQLARCGPQLLAPAPASTWAFVSGVAVGIAELLSVRQWTASVAAAAAQLQGLRVGQRLLISYDVDPDLFHERLVLQRPPNRPGCTYLVATPDGDLYEEDLLDSGGEVFVLGPRGGLLGGMPAAATLYRFDAGYLAANKDRFIQEGRDELARIRADEGFAFVDAGDGPPPPLAAPAGGPPGAAALMAVDAPGAAGAGGPPVRWCVLESRFGKAAGDDVSDLVGARFIQGDRGIIMIADGLFMCIARAGSFTKGADVDSKEQDVRTLAVRVDSHGRREATFQDVCKQLDSISISDWRISGPRTAVWLCRALSETGMSPTQRHYWWRNTIGLTVSDNGVDEHLFLSELLEWALCYDFLSFGSLIIAEHISRRYQLWEEVYSHTLMEREAGASAAEWVDERRIFLGTHKSRGVALVCPELQSYVACEMASSAAILKERRKGREERRLAGGLGEEADEGSGGAGGGAAKAKGRNGPRK
ncbi:unnamed protein product [Prorocentrum cordatum]|uniref:Uncharacterized protein n=1 Tax=Prorocentrum cordatum TaxID=2364126 RepID=A0ABN9QSC6_9DINO|nr:unnamed protein product [Polarella glacialis]